jgi:hypothetical protein
LGYLNTVPSDLNSDALVAFFDTAVSIHHFQFNILWNSVGHTIVINAQGLKITFTPE